MYLVNSPESADVAEVLCTVPAYQTSSLFDHVTSSLPFLLPNICKRQMIFLEQESVNPTARGILISEVPSRTN